MTKFVKWWVSERVVNPHYDWISEVGFLEVYYGNSVVCGERVRNTLCGYRSKRFIIKPTITFTLARLENLANGNA